jgi:photosystem II stability/assembly factor-like uncharacterized protein
MATETKPQWCKATRHKNISRLDYPPKRMRGYWVRIQWQGEKHAKFFSDHFYGDALAALDAAKEWRNATEKAIGKPRTERLVIGAARASNTGVLGVRRLKENHTEYFEATWVAESGKMGRTRFSIAKHGEKKALRYAIKARQLHERERWHTKRRDDG